MLQSTLTNQLRGRHGRTGRALELVKAKPEPSGHGPDRRLLGETQVLPLKQGLLRTPVPGGRRGGSGTQPPWAVTSGPPPEHPLD